ncbi:hypothetical protein Q4511_08145 [Paracoccus sp. 1_MG-2023]|uniref:hypothetical protein n=1 Tax=unclassified Paracoccus (in: a-proteobacteria) TaxID=2688777 RepID=UPI001C08DA93|nr:MULTISPECIES: hypothetical protein [unclassified Paracoccus (in: a-proteobacteria)]MBU2957915.1 hypothetical protein [Paracoccus sp. C2R09]MDO6668892.1 hypothetical protein [Paracoccus sp. 1_MG-2023]
MDYDELVSWRRLPRTTYVFADIERLTAAQLPAVMKRIDALRQICPECRMLNLPGQIGSRLDIMRRLHEAGINDFRMLPITTPAHEFRFPVFLRRLDDHDGPRSDLIDSPAKLEEAIAKLSPEERSGDQFTVTEYVDARNEWGFHEKRSYMRVQDSLFPAALDQSRQWVCKGEYDDPGTVPTPERELDFLQSETDMAALQAAFDAAGIEYGRADYAMIGGRSQVFEINTNPWLEPPENVPEAARRGAEHIVQAWLKALAALESADAADQFNWVEVPDRAGRSRQRVSRRAAIRASLTYSRQLHNETRVMRRMRAIGLI